MSKPSWEIAPTGDFYSLSLRVHKVPCWVHRLMQRLVLGIRYRRVQSIEDKK